MEALKEERQSFPFVRYEKVSDENVLLTAVISNEGMTLGYRMTEMGVYGRLEGEEEEVLCSIAITPSQEEADFWPPWNGLAPMEIVQRYYISISPEAVPVITVDQGSALAEIAAETRRAQSEEGRLGEKIEEEEARAAGEEEKLYRFVETGMAGVTEAIEGEARRALQSEAELESRKVDRVEGKQLSSNDYTSIEKDKVHVAYDKSHSHENRSVLETISAELLGKWNSAVEHITDTLKHVTEAEREKWDDAWGKRHSHGNAGVLGKITQAMLDKLNGIAEGANHYAHPTGTGYKHIPSGGSSGQILRWSADGTAQWGNDNNTTYGNMKAATSTAGGGAGLVPAPGAGAQGKYLRGDGTWQMPPNTTYSAMTAATASAAGKAGLVPAPAAGAQVKYLRGDGTWAALANNCTTTAGGLPLDARQGKTLMDRITQQSSDLAKVRTYVGSDGKLHFVNSAGADTVLPFSKGQGKYIKQGQTITFSGVKHGYIVYACHTTYTNSQMSKSDNVKLSTLSEWKSAQPSVSATDVRLYEFSVTNSSSITFSLESSASGLIGAFVLIYCDQ